MSKLMVPRAISDMTKPELFKIKEDYICGSPACKTE